MLPYWLMFGVAATGALAYGEPRRDGSAAPLIAFAAALALLIGLRFLVGGDWFNYLGIYREIGVMSLVQAITLPQGDPAYSLLNWLSTQVGIGIWLTNLVCGALLIWGVTALALRQPNPWLVFVVAIPYLIIVVGMGYTRQAAAIGLVIVSITAVIDNKLGKFIVCIMGAALFHKSAVVMLPIVGLAISEKRTTSVAILLLLGIILYVNLVSAQLDIMTQNYVHNDALQSAGAVQRIALNVVPSAVFLFAQRHFGFSERERVIWRNVAIASLGAGLALFLFSSSTVIDRLALYLAPIQMVIYARLPWALGGGGLGRAYLLTTILAASATIQFVWLNYAANAHQWIPYRSYLTE